MKDFYQRLPFLSKNFPLASEVVLLQGRPITSPCLLNRASLYTALARLRYDHARESTLAKHAMINNFSVMTALKLTLIE